MRTRNRIIGAVALILTPALLAFDNPEHGDGNMFSIFEASNGRECPFDLHQYNPDQRGTDAAEEMRAARAFADLVPEMKFIGIRNELRGGTFCF